MRRTLCLIGQSDLIRSPVEKNGGFSFAFFHASKSARNSEKSEAKVNVKNQAMEQHRSAPLLPFRSRLSTMNHTFLTHTLLNHMNYAFEFLHNQALALRFRKEANKGK